MTFKMQENRLFPLDPEKGQVFFVVRDVPENSLKHPSFT
jgi:hypothetical protein